jgi:hypothetical protein
VVVAVTMSVAVTVKESVVAVRVLVVTGTAIVAEVVDAEVWQFVPIILM